jgi:hypothetical protein
MPAIDSDESTIQQPTYAHAAALEGVTGRLRLDIGANPVAMLEVRDGDVELRRGGGAADAVARCDSEATISSIGRGLLNPVVAALQNRLEITGDRVFAIKVILGLRGWQADRGERTGAP